MRRPACLAAAEGSSTNAGQPAIGVNGYLWRATLDTVLHAAGLSRPYGGVIITDWFVNPDQPNERFKATVYILDSRLRC
jgi:hypothetical protein